jgi:hypothetical protein
MKTLLPAILAACLPIAAQTAPAAGAGALDRREFRAAIAEAVSLADRHGFASLATDERDNAPEPVDSHFYLPGNGECYLEPRTRNWLECSVKCHHDEAWPAFFAKLETIFATLPNLSRAGEVRRSTLWVDEYRSTAASRVSITWDPSFTRRVILIRFTSPERPAQGGKITP